MNRTASLIEATAEQPHITIEELAPDYPVIHVSNPQATASIALHGAHLISYQPSGQDPVIFTSRDAVFREGKAIRGGVPICWPWFSAHRDAGNGYPSHGLARTSFWQLEQIECGADTTTLVLSFTTDGSDASWPYACKATLTITVGSTLAISLRSDNLSDSAIEISEALHSYFQVGMADQTEVIGLQGCDYVFSLSDTEVKSQDAPIVINEAIDRVYHSEATIEIADRSNQRTIIVEKHNSQTTVVWNPGAEAAAAMGDLANDEYHHFVCVEPANAWPNRMTLAPGTSHTSSMTVSVK
ncbi:D-hexose-6-phosphate mutarotase [Sulfuriroseicoccus oceanibius]|uniref:Putative glucose-6-phosphate 1-epimerase n=1 Tax=Sulfuriroseicoccus oceanibius TaxID=2707525 RepID=A0A6B3LC30_9BACT|nr:D-hexose-6-phosphate mutarotase [Sulfuriroseicoccus oceanibius]QQL46210.1 D-hexose-6-phosphate mutarotase [Sulfuriroseicoccus oceanibius]